jgi:D-xylose transport system substrate-binding protein
MKQQLLAVSGAALAVMSVLAGCASHDGGDGKKVYFLIPNSTTTRFEQRDAPLLKEAMKRESPGTSVTVFNAEGDAAKQQNQVNDAITQGASAIVLVTTDANLSAGALAAAKQANVPVILEEHDAIGGPADVQVVFDPFKIGQEQGKRAAQLLNAMPGQGLKVARVKGNPGEYGTNQFQKGQDEFLQPLIDSGKITIACDKNIPNWDPVAGQAFAEDCLTKENNNISLFVTMNDDLAGGIIAALTTQNLVGKIPVTGGQDANLTALQYIAQGKQDNTIFKNLGDMADTVAKVTASILDGKGVPQDMINGKVNNQFMDVPAVMMPVQNVTKDNLQVVVDAKFYTWDQICQPDPTSDVCKSHA